VLIVCLKIFYDIIPGVSQETSWTLTNISYMFGSYLMFHWVRGVPFDFNSGAYDNLNMWEQIDNGDQYTPAKKFLLSVPVVLFLVSTHYTHYDLTYFLINFLATLAVVIPKLPAVSIPRQQHTLYWRYRANECGCRHTDYELSSSQEHQTTIHSPSYPVITFSTPLSHLPRAMAYGTTQQILHSNGVCKKVRILAKIPLLLFGVGCSRKNH
jgi:hypothetical protein